MNSALNHRTIDSLCDAARNVADLTALVGPDGFVDEICRVVGSRLSATNYLRMDRLTDLGERIIAAAGQSTNLEIVVDRIKLGGNGPIMANALAALGADVTCIGPFDEGTGGTHPAFTEIGARAHLLSLGEPAHTDALEFDDGKLMLGKLEPLTSVTWQRMLDRIGARDLSRLITQSGLVALVNWTMVPSMSEIWEQALAVLAGAEDRDVDRAHFFFDLSDPEKHSDESVATACRTLARFQQFGRTILGLNEKEAIRVGSALGYRGAQASRDDVRAVAEFVSSALPLETVVVHPRAYAVVASAGVVTADIDGPFTETPAISTGAGDHFNAGFCFGKLLGLPDDEAATAAVGTSGYYVRHANSPTLNQLTDFLLGSVDQ